jgi:hypothetical protein
MDTGLVQPSRTRDYRIDWLRGVAMTCVIVNHSQLPSLLSWVSYERFWVVTAAEVFVVLSGIVLGMVYGRRLASNGWGVVVRGVARRTAFLYFSFVAVTVSVLALAWLGVDVRAVALSGGHANAWSNSPQTMDLDAWFDVLVMRSGPWAFSIIGLYVWLVAAAVPSFLLLQWAGWRGPLAVSWALYLWYRLDPHAVTPGGFESAFPLLAWQLIFVHGIVIGYYRESIAAAVQRMPQWVPAVVVCATVLFTAFALCNPSTDGPSWLYASLMSPDRFTGLYGRYFVLKHLGVGRLLNLAVALPTGYALLTRCWWLIRPLHGIFITLGQQSLGAFVLHVYALVLIPYLPLSGDVLINTLAQIAIVVCIAGILGGRPRRKLPQRAPTPLAAEPYAA